MMDISTLRPTPEDTAVHLVTIGAIERPSLECPPHRHPMWEFVIYTEGEGETTVGRQHIPMAPGVVVCMPPHLLQHERSPQGYRNIYMLVDDVPHLPARPAWYRDEPEQPFLTLATLLNREFHHRRQGWQRTVHSLLEMIFVQLDRWRGEDGPSPEVTQLERILIDNLHNPDFTIAEAMAQVPLSSNHLRRCFQQATGKTPVAYLSDLRIEEARTLLGTCGYTVREAALRVGIADPYYFSRLFRRKTGIAPSAYREHAATVRPATHNS